MRAAFAEALTRLATNDERVVLLTGDLGFAVLEPFRDTHPGRFYNIGVAEQNMLGIATGLAEAGYVPFVYSIGTFASMRGYEFFRNGAVLHRLPVRLVGVGAGFDYGLNGVSHYALEDVALMRAQPGLTVIAPADASQAERAIFETADHPNPIYFRIARQGAPVPGLDGRFEVERLDVLRTGDDVALIALGTAVWPALEAAEELTRAGISAAVAVVSTVAPPPVDDLVDLLREIPVAVSVEAHYTVGGLGSLVAEVIAEERLGCALVRCGPREVPRRSGTQEFLYDAHGLSPARIAHEAAAFLGTRR